MSVDNKVPEIRFEGFSGEWEEKILENICDVRDGTHASPQYHQKGFPLVTSKNVKNGYINYDDVQYISKTDFDEINKRSKVDVNDILMGMIGTIGNLALIREAEDFAIKNVALIKDKNLIDCLYIYYFLQSPTITEQLEDCASGGTQKFISLNNVRRLLTYLPEREEQPKIGNYFQKLDALINQHQQKHDKLSNIKKSMLEKMFPKQGETMPEIRFKGFSGEWESKILGSVSSFYKGKDLPKSSIQEDSVYPCIHYGELFTKYSEVIEVVTSRTNQRDNFFSISNDVLMPTSDVTPKGLVKSCCVKQNGVVLGGDILIIRPNGQNVIDGAFLSRFIRTREQQVLQNVTGSTVFHLYASSIENLDIVFPSIKEQTAIGNYFQKLDNLINQHQQQITKLNNIKQACLSKMFV